MGSAEPGAPSTVVARMHYMTAAEMKWTMSFLHAAEVAAAGEVACLHCSETIPCFRAFCSTRPKIFHPQFRINLL